MSIDNFEYFESIIRTNKRYDASGEVLFLTNIILQAIRDIKSEDAVVWLRSKYCQSLCKALGYDHKALMKGLDIEVKKLARKPRDHISKEQKDGIIAAYKQGGVTHRFIAKMFGVSRQCVGRNVKGA